MRSRSFVAILLLGLLSACSDKPENDVPAKAFDQFPAQRIAAADEWRDGRRVGGGTSVAIDLGAAAAGGALRVSFFDDATGNIRVFAGDRRVHEWRLNSRGAWRDERVEIRDAPNGPLRLVVDTDSAILMASCEVLPPRPGNLPPNVLVFLIDTLRQDHVSAYGYARDTTPSLRALAADGTLMTHLTPSSSWTRPSVASLFTSMYPNYHGAQTIRDKLRGELPSLAAALAAKGYETQGLMTNANCLPVWGFGGDFARYVDVDTRLKKAPRNDPPVTDAAIAAIEHLRGRPWYLYVHTMGPHKPYDPPEPFRGQFAPDARRPDADAQRLQTELDLYDAEIAHTDFQFGRIVDALKATGQYDNTLIVVLSDHGEEFMDHGGWEHGQTLFEEMLRVPLIVKPPKGEWTAPGRVEALVEMVDIAPTILDIVDAEIPERFQGRSFLPLLRGEAEAPRTGYASLNLRWFSLRAAKTLEHKYIRDVAKGSDAWYDLVADPKETRPIGEAGQWGGTLQQHVATRSLGGSSGLHVLITADDAPMAGTITLHSDRLGQATVSGSEWKSVVAPKDGGVQWDLSPEKSLLVEAMADGDAPRQAAGRVYTHLRAEVPMDAEVRLDVRLDNAAIDPARVHLGRQRAQGALANATLKPSDLLAHPDDFDLAALPNGIGVYIWYVASPESVAEQDVPAEVREALEALGYVN